jgi:SAM-dependent methyltransferase
MRRYRDRVFALLRDAFRPFAPVHRALDFGAGDGWYARAFQDAGLAREIVGVDVQPRARPYVPTVLYDGRRVPFDDRHFDLVSSIDVLHHCPDPRASLIEALRCSSRFFLLKDHTYETLPGKLALAVLDELGNRRFGIPSPYHYQRGRTWFPWIEAEGFALRALVHPAPCHRAILGWMTNPLQLVSLWERTA